MFNKIALFCIEIGNDLNCIDYIGLIAKMNNLSRLYSYFFGTEVMRNDMKRPALPPTRSKSVLVKIVPFCVNMFKPSVQFDIWSANV